MLTLKKLKDLIQEKDRKFGMTTPCNRCGEYGLGRCMPTHLQALRILRYSDLSLHFVAKRRNSG